MLNAHNKKSTLWMQVLLMAPLFLLGSCVGCKWELKETPQQMLESEERVILNKLAGTLRLSFAQQEKINKKNREDKVGMTVKEANKELGEREYLKGTLSQAPDDAAADMARKVLVPILNVLDEEEIYLPRDKKTLQEALSLLIELQRNLIKQLKLKEGPKSNQYDY